MYYYNFLLFFIFAGMGLCDPNDPTHPLHQRLKHWEVLEAEDVQFHRSKRDFGNSEELPTLDKQVSFNALNRRFVLSLMSSPDILSSDFEAYVAGNRGNRKVKIDKQTLYTGTVLDEPESTVNAHINGKTMTAQIDTKKGTYIVEPLWRHEFKSEDLTKKQSPNMIIYREKDMKKNFNKPHDKKNGFCDTKTLMQDIRNPKFKKSVEDYAKLDEDVEEYKRRPKRSTGTANKICNLSLYADYKFFKNMGNSNIQQTIYYLIQLIGRVNNIYKNTNWDTEAKTDEYKYYGFQIGNITVYEEYTIEPRFNSQKTDWNSCELLEAFSEMDHHAFCLAHLFTYVDFDNGVLGLAYVGSDKIEDVGGICTKKYPRGIGQPVQYLNTGLTTTLNWGSRILTREADLVTTHELGHNLGAEHDNDEIKECSPGQGNNGNYVMYPAAVSGEYDNNKKFSNCSKHSILRTLKWKAPQCFVKEKKSFCGNYKVEEGEECDVGYIGHEEHASDRCCNSFCKLKEGALCSHRNHECCGPDCKPAPRSTICYSEVPDLCFEDTHCDGENVTCPQPQPKKPGSDCGDKGKCDSKGTCQPFCQTVNMKTCLCSKNKEEFCMRCCAPLEGDGECAPYKPPGNNSQLLLRDNARCINGHCRNGECIKQTQDVIERVWDIFEHIAPNKIGEFLADNIVGAVLVFSLMFWVPCGCLIHFVDKKRDKHRKQENQWWTEKGNEFMRNTSHITGSMFLPAPPSAGINGQRKSNWPGVVKLGIGAKEQWQASQERGIAVRRSVELGDGELNGLPTPSVSDSSLAQPLAQSSPPMTRPSLQAQPAPIQFTRPETQLTHRPTLRRQENALDESTMEESVA